MRKTACTDKKLVLFSPKMTAIAKTVVAFFAFPSLRVPVYARYRRLPMVVVFPKKRRIRDCQRVSPKRMECVRSKIKRLSSAYYDEAVIPVKKCAPLLPESV